MIVRLGDLPVLGHTDITLEATVYGAILGLRAVALILCGALYTAAVDPDEVLRLFRRVSFRSALTATLATRMVPVLVRDSRRLADAQRCRPGPPPSRFALMRAASSGRARPRARRRGGARGPRVRRGAPPAALPPAVLASRPRVRRRGGGGARDRHHRAYRPDLAPFQAYPALHAPRGSAARGRGRRSLACALLPFADRRGIER